VWGVWGTSRSDVWSVGFIELLIHYDGSTWSSVASGFGLRATVPGWNESQPFAVWGSSPSNLWLVGKEEGPVDDTCCAKMTHYNGTSWSDVPLPANTPFMTAIWGSSATDVWAASRNGIYHGTR
jgi:hypothetical protein